MIKEVEKIKLEENNSGLDPAQKKEEFVREAESNLTDIEAEAMAKQDYILENIIDDIKENPEAAHDENYKKIFKNVMQNNIKDFAEVKKEISDEKQRLINKVNKGNKGFSADISKKRALQKAYIEVFNKKSDKITFADYTVLLEMKRILDVDEQVGISDLEEVV